MTMASGKRFAVRICMILAYSISGLGPQVRQSDRKLSIVRILASRGLLEIEHDIKHLVLVLDSSRRTSRVNHCAGKNCANSVCVLTSASYQ